MKKRFVLVALLCLMCLTLFAACDRGERDQGSDVKIPQEEITTAGAIYDSLDITLDRDTMLNTEAEQLAKRAFGAGKEVLGYNIADGIISVVATVTDGSLGSVAAVISVQTQPYLDGDIKKMVLKDAGGYTIEQQIAESQSAQVAASITEAFEEIVGRIDRISEGNLRRVNYYPFEQTMQNGDQLCVFGPVRSDGSFVKLDVSENGEIVETVILVQDAKDMQPEEVYDAYLNGAEYVSGEPRTIDTGKAYTSPPTGQLQPDPDWGGSNPDDPTPGGDEETTTFEEIYNQVFGEGFVVNTNVDDIMTDLAERVFSSSTNVKVVAVDTNNAFTLYAEGVDAIGRTALIEGKYTGSDLETIIANLSLLQQIESAGGWESYINSFAPSAPVEEGSASYAQLIETLQSIKNNIENTDVLSSLTRKDFSAKNIINATRDALPAPSNDFGEALMQDMGASGTIIATYVGDLQQRLIDSTGMFDTGYYCAYDLAFVYYADNSIHIKQVSILNEWSDSSTNDSLYGYVLANHEDKYLIKDGAEIVVPDVSFINPYNKGQKEIELQK